MLNVAKKHVNLAATMIRVAKTILVDLYFTSDSLTIQTWSNKDVVEIDRFSAWESQYLGNGLEVS